MPNLDRVLDALNQRPGEMQALAVSFSHHLNSRGLSPATVYTYLTAIRLFNEHLVRQNHDRKIAGIARKDVEGFISSILAVRSPGTASNRYRALQQFFRWCVEEGEISISPMQNTKPPKVPEKDVPVIPNEHLKRLLATCAKGREFDDVRDYAILRIYITTGARRSEVANLVLEDLDMRNGEVFLMGKGAKPRVVTLDVETHRAVDRYLRLRAKHPSADLDAVWISRQSGQLTHWGIQQMVERRARQSGIGDIHLHQFRHTFAHLALSNGMQESDLMRVAGWSSRQMVDRYGRSNADQRARDAHRKLAKVFPV